ncbi:MAG: maleylpyruvate isomerase N-terminal domain-containing protein [Ilumatobacteraceae bacterium]
MLHAASALRSVFALLGAQYIELSRTLTNEDLARPGLTGWTVQELLGHALRAFSTLESYLDAAPSTDVTMDGAGDYYRTVLADPTIHADVAERGRQAGAALGTSAAEVASIVETTVSTALARVDAADDHDDVNTFAGRIGLPAYLATRIVEAGVHLLDLQRAVGAPVNLDAATIEMVLVTLAEVGDATAIVLALTGRGALPTGFNVLA